MSLVNAKWGVLNMHAVAFLINICIYANSFVKNEILATSFLVVNVLFTI